MKTLKLLILFVFLSVGLSSVAQAQIYNGYLGDITDEQLHEAYGIRLTADEYFAYGNNFIRLVQGRYESARRRCLAEKSFDPLETSIIEITRIYPIVLALEDEYPDTSTHMVDHLRVVLGCYLKILNFYSCKASILPLIQHRDVDTFEDRILRNTYLKCAHLLERICESEPEMYESEEYLLKLFALYHAADDNDGCIKTQVLLQGVIERNILEPFAKLKDELAQISGKPDKIVLLKCQLVQDYFVAHGEIFEILREIRARGMDSNVLVQLHWDIINLVLSLTAETIQLHTWELIGLYNKRNEHGNSPALQEAIYKTHKALLGNLIFLNKVNPDYYLEFFEGLALSESYRPAYSAHLIAIIETISKYIGPLEADDSIEIADDIMKELRRLQIFYKYHFEKPLVVQPINQDQILNEIHRLAGHCERLNAILLQLNPDEFHINDLTRAYSEYAVLRALHAKLMQRIPVTERDLRQRLRYVMDFCLQCHDDIKYLINIYFDRVCSQYLRTQVFDDYDRIMRVYYLLLNLNVGMKSEFPSRDMEYDLIEDLEPLLSDCLKKFMRQTEDPTVKICVEACSKPRLPPDGANDDDDMRTRRKVYNQCASLLVDISRYIYEEHERDKCLDTLFCNNVGVHLCRAILLYECCSDAKQVEDIQNLLLNWLRQHLYEPVMQSLSYTVVLDLSSPQFFRQEASTLFKAVQQERNVKDNSSKERFLWALELITEMRELRDNPELVKMHMQLAFKYLERCCQAYLEGGAISLSHELDEVRNTFKEVYNNIFKKLPAPDEDKVHFVKLCIKAVNMLFEQQKSTLQSENHETCTLLENYIHSLVTNSLENPSFYSLGLVAEDENLVRNLQLTRIHSKINAAQATFYYGEFGLSKKLAEAAIDMINALVEEYPSEASERKDLQRALDRMKEHLVRIEQQLQRHKRPALTSIKDVEPPDPKTSRKNP